MSETPVDPTVARPYLSEPDYYRLGYQLSAQLMNAASDRDADPDRVQAKEADATSPLAAVAGKPEGRKAASATAENLLDEVEEMIAWYGRRHGTEDPQDELSPQEQRLDEFLRRTVKPCLELVIAGSMRSRGQARPAEKAVEPLREEAALAELSYRALYNLACYESGDGEKSAGRAIAYLKAALRWAPAERVQVLADWAARDPSLLSLHDHPHFRELMTVFGSPKQEEKAAGGTDVISVLKAVVAKPGINAEELAKALKIDPSYLQRVLAELSKESLIKEDPHYFPERSGEPSVNA